MTNAQVILAYPAGKALVLACPWGFMRFVRSPGGIEHTLIARANTSADQLTIDRCAAALLNRPAALLAV